MLPEECKEFLGVYHVVFEQRCYAVMVFFATVSYVLLDESVYVDHGLCGDWGV